MNINRTLIALSVSCAVFACQPVTTEQRLQEIDTLVQQGDINAAVIGLKALVQTTPEDLTLRQKLGEALYAQGDLASAAREFSKTGDLSWQAAALYHQGRYEDVILLTNSAINGIPHELVIFDFVASLRSNQKPNAAYLRAKNSLPTDLHSILELYRAPTEAKIAAANAVISTLKKPVLFAEDLVLLRASLLRQQQQYEAAIDLMAPLAARWVAVPIVSFTYIDLLLRAGRYDDAEKEVAKWMTDNLNNPWANLAQAQVEMSRGELNKVLVLSQRAMSAGMDNMQINALAGTAAQQLGNLELAYQYLNKANNQAPNITPIMQQLAAVQLQLGYVDEAESLLQSMQVETPEDVDFIKSATGFLYAKGQANSAKLILKETLNEMPEQRDLLRQLAALQLETGENAIFIAQQLQKTDETSVGANFLLVQSHLEAGQIARAREVAESFVTRNEAQGKLLLAFIALNQKQFDEGLDISQQVLNIESENTGALRVAMLSAYSLSKLELAIKYAVALVKQQPNSRQANTDFVYLLAQTQRQVNIVEQAKQLLAVENLPSQTSESIASYWSSKGEYAEATRLLASVTSLSVDGHKRLLNLYLQTKESQKAITHATAWYESQPDSADALLSLAAVYEASVQYQDVVRVVETAMKRFASDPRLAVVLYNAYMQLGQPEKAAEAIPAMEKGRVPLDIIAQFQGENAYALKRYEQALEFYQKAYAQKPGFVASALLAKTYSQLEKAAQGRDVLMAELARQLPESAVLLHTAAEYMSVHKFPEQAQEVYQKLLEKYPNDHAAMNNLASSLLQSGRLDEARSLAESAVAFDANGYYMDTLGWVLFKQGNTTLARKHLEQALEKLPDNEEIALHLAEVHVLEKDISAASELISTFASKSRNNQSEWQLLQQRIGK